MTAPAPQNLEVTTVTTHPSSAPIAPPSSEPSRGPLNLTPAQWALLIAGVAVIFALRRWRAIQAQKTKKLLARSADPLTKIPVAGTLGPALNMRDVTVQVQSLLTDVEDTARRAAAQVDNRYMKLEVLLAEADAKIKRLEELCGKAGATPDAAEGRKIAEKLRDATELPPRMAHEDAAYGPVYQLADAGMSAREIAQKLGKQPGEIELILALRASGKRG